MAVVWSSTFLFSVVLYLFVEKPGTDARIAFTERYDPTKSPWAPKERPVKPTEPI